MKIYNMAVAILLVLSVSGCSKNHKTDNATSRVKTGIAITVSCILNATASDIDTYQTIQTGDEIIKDDTNTTVNIVVDSLGNQKICLQSGSAHILR